MQVMSAMFVAVLLAMTVSLEEKDASTVVFEIFDEDNQTIDGKDAINQFGAMKKLYADYNTTINCPAVNSEKTVSSKKITGVYECSTVKLTSEIEEESKTRTKHTLFFENLSSVTRTETGSISFLADGNHIVVDNGFSVNTGERSLSYSPVRSFSVIPDSNELKEFRSFSVIPDSNELKEFYSGFQFSIRDNGNYVGLYDFSDMRDLNNVAVSIETEGNRLKATISFSVTLSPFEKLVVDPVSDISAGLKGCWRMDENTGSTVADCSGNGNTGTLEGNAFFGQGYTRTGLELDGVGDDLNVGSAAAFDNLRTLTVSAWIRSNNFNQQGQIVNKMNTNFTGPLFGVNTSGRFFLYIWRIGGVAFSQSVTDTLQPNKWYFLASTWTDGEEPKLYIGADGNIGTPAYSNFQVGSGAYADDSDRHMIIGSRFDGADVNGTIDEVRIYNRVLSPADINALYYCQPPTYGPDWIIDAGAQCALDRNIDMNSTVNVKSGTLNIPDNNTLSISNGGRLLLGLNAFFGDAKLFIQSASGKLLFPR